MNAPANWPNSTETMAERAWRYGETGFVCRKQNGIVWFSDGSCMARWYVDTDRGVRHKLEVIRALYGLDLTVESLYSAARGRA